VTADGQSVLALASGPDAATALTGLAGQPVTATGARVLSVPADEGFWLGTSETERIRVQLTGEAGESPYQVQEGDLVDFEATVVEHEAGFPGEVGVDDAEGAQQLAEQARTSLRRSPPCGSPPEEGPRPPHPSRAQGGARDGAIGLGDALEGAIRIDR
jgi:hypothetical protein